MNEKFFEICKKESLCSDHYQHKIGSCIVIKNRVVSKAFNQLKTHPDSWHPFKSCHAEFLAIYRAKDYDLRGATIYVFRQHRNGEPALSRPCPHCYAEICKRGIAKIVYTDYNGYKIEEI